jgi:hypothetical protein
MMPPSGTECSIQTKILDRKPSYHLLSVKALGIKHSEAIVCSTRQLHLANLVGLADWYSPKTPWAVFPNLHNHSTCAISQACLPQANLGNKGGASGLNSLVYAFPGTSKPKFMSYHFTRKFSKTHLSLPLTDMVRIICPYPGCSKHLPLQLVHSPQFTL